jgi:hypothetical protein
MNPNIEILIVPSLFYLTITWLMDDPRMVWNWQYGGFQNIFSELVGENDLVVTRF